MTKQTAVALGAIIIVLGFFALFGLGYALPQNEIIDRGDVGASEDGEVTSFEECVEAGNPVMESYPRQCRSEAGRLFVEDIDVEADTEGQATTTDNMRSLDDAIIEETL